jgi:hypothetical protein
VKTRVHKFTLASFAAVDIMLDGFNDGIIIGEIVVRGVHSGGIICKRNVGIVHNM